MSVAEYSTRDFSKNIINSMRDCILCPRKCHANRLEGEVGYCGRSAELTAARAALYYWEEPCISGNRGSGTVFFSGCNLRCVYCQNHNIAVGNAGRPISLHRLSEIFLELQEKGAHNINLVTPSHYIPQIVHALTAAKDLGLAIPVVYNTGSYEEIDSLRMLDGLVDIYLPDLKYFSPQLSSLYSHAPDYFEKASAAIAEMFRQTGKALMEPDSSSGLILMKRGVMVRHLVLPGQTADSKKLLRHLIETYKNDIYVSIMSQYTPLPHAAEYPPLDRPVSEDEYRRVISFALRLGLENGFMQEGGADSDSFIPEFDGEGL